MISHIKWYDKCLNEIPDSDLINYFNRAKAGNRKPVIREDTARIWVAIMRVFDSCGTPMTVRQVFYQLEVLGFVEKSENGYRQAAKQLVAMRKGGVLPYNFIADETRYVHKPDTHQNLQTYMDLSIQTYRRALWLNQPVNVEIWIEKRALIGVVSDITGEYDVPLYPCGGYPSLSFISGAAEFIKASQKPVFIYYFGDHDPTGKDIPRSIQETLTDLGAEYHFEQMAVTEEQISEWDLPTRPTKKTDSRSRDWQGDSVELDAIPPQTLKNLVRSCIERHIDLDLLERTRAAERAERDTLTAITKTIPQLGTSTQLSSGVS